MKSVVSRQLKGFVKVLDVITAYDTPELADNIISDCGDYILNLYPDATGQARSRQGFSDFEILRRKFDNAGIQYSMHYPAQNGLVRDRVNAVNSIFENAKGESHILIHPRCKPLIRDLQQVSYLKNSREVDKTNADLTHSSDALGYYIVRKFPIRAKWRV